MKDQQLSTEPAQTSDTTPEAAPEEMHHLPPPVYRETASVRPGDAQALAALLDQYPGMQQQILAVASSHAGAATVRQAIELHRRGGRAAPAPATVSAQQYGPGGFAELEGGAPSPSSPVLPAPAEQAPVEAVPAASARAEPAPVEAAPAKPAHAEPAWAMRARKYNAANPTLVDEFNDLTDDACNTEAGGLNPIDVAHWQRANGLAADGMVGPQTVAAARKYRAKGDRLALDARAARDAEDRPPI